MNVHAFFFLFPIHSSLAKDLGHISPRQATRCLGKCRLDDLTTLVRVFYFAALKYLIAMHERGTVLSNLL